MTITVAKGRTPQQKNPVPPGWGFGVGPISPCCKSKVITGTKKNGPYLIWGQGTSVT